MKSLCTAALALLVCLGWSASAADAQSGAYQTRPSLLPLPPVTQVSSNLVPVGYTSYYDRGTSGAPQESPQPHVGGQQYSQSAPGGFESSFTTKTRAFGDEPANEQPAAAATASTSPWCGCEDALHETCWDDEGCCAIGERCGCGYFFGTVGGLVMTRARAPAFTTTYADGAPPFTPLMNTQHAGADWVGGGEVTFGYAFGGANDVGPWGACGMCGGPGLALTWWGLGEMTGFHQVDGTLDASFNIAGAPAIATNFVDADSQRIFRTDNVNSFEANLLQGAFVNTGRLQLIGLVGFRYFRFSEVLTFGSLLDLGVGNWGVDPANETYLTFRTINNLYGGQLGAVFNYIVTPRLSLYATPKAGVYGNQMIVRTLLVDGDGTPGYNIPARKSDVAFLGQIDAGLNYMVRSNVRLYVGYRIVGVSNVALGDNQFLPALADTTGYTQVKQSGNLILHGVTFGAAWMF